MEVWPWLSPLYSVISAKRMKSYFNRMAGDFFHVGSAVPPTVIWNIAGWVKRKVLASCRVRFAGRAQQTQKDLSHSADFKRVLNFPMYFRDHLHFKKSSQGKSAWSPPFIFFDHALNTLRRDLCHPFTWASYAGTVQDKWWTILILLLESLEDSRCLKRSFTSFDDRFRWSNIFVLFYKSKTEQILHDCFITKCVCTLATKNAANS